MAIKPRIHWAWDGAAMYVLNGDWTKGAEYTQDYKNAFDGDELISWYGGSGSSIFQFVDLCQLHSIKFRIHSAVSPIKAWVSEENVPNDFYPIGDPQWTQILDGSYAPAVNYVELALSPITNCKWLIVLFPFTINLQCIHFFGEYVAPNFEFWNTGETAELNTEQIPFDLPNAPNSVDYHQYENFKLKNTDSSTHSYSLTIGPVKYGGDTLITNNFKLAKYSDGYTKSGTITLSNIGAGAFSENLRVYGDILINANPADGKHYFVIDVTETA